jgi:signal transduction histidine kinase
MAINRGQLTPEQIFKATVESITRVSDTKAANLLLLRDTDNPLLSISQSPLLSVSTGLSQDYDEQVKPRLAGLTALVLTKRKPHAVSHPDEAPGINPLAQQQGIRACLCLPLMIQDTIIGILFVHYARPHNFTDNEIHMLSLFANQAALAIENARQREDLQLSEAVVWSGIAISTLAHSITQKIGAIDNVVWGLSKMLQGMQPAIERLERIAESVRVAKEILGKARTGFSHKVTLLDLNTTLIAQIPHWLPPTEGIIFDTSGLTSDSLLVRADPNWLNFALEILINNASRAMSSAVQKQLIVTSTSRSGHAIVEISNTGEAIPAEIQAQLFKKRITKVLNNESSGIGLLHARVIMRRYKGDVELVTSDAEWTKFALRLPLARLGTPQQELMEGK